jgi:hypothetical protein
VSVCRSCHDPILWVTMAQTRKKIPVQPIETPYVSNSVLVVDGAWGYSIGQLGRILAQRERVSEIRGRELASTRYPAHVPHFAKCPHAAQHRRTGMTAAVDGLGLVDARTRWTSHVAGAVLAGLQRCARCHLVLVDDQQPLFLDGKPVNRLYDRGSCVVRLGDVVTAPARPGRLPAGSRPCKPNGDQS